MRKTQLLLYILLVFVSSLACQIVTVTNELPSAPSANALPTPVKLQPTPKPTACLIVRALPGGDGNLNLRSGAGTSYAVLAVLQDGQALAKDGERGDWYAVTVVMDGERVRGFVRSEYVEACE